MKTPRKSIRVFEHDRELLVKLYRRRAFPSINTRIVQQTLEVCMTSGANRLAEMILRTNCYTTCEAKERWANGYV